MNTTRKDLVEIDVSTVTEPRELQLMLMNALDFPDWYGCNWNAFWDAITGLVGMPKKLRIIGWQLLAVRLPDDARIMRECLEEMATKYASWASEVEYA